MLGRIDSALAGAIDYVADDLTATVKSVRENGMKTTLAHAVEDAASLVKDGAKNAIGLAGRKGPAPVSSHSGMSGGYADMMAGRQTGFGGVGQFQYNGPAPGGAQGAPQGAPNGGAQYQYNGAPNGGAQFQYNGAGGGAGGAAAYPYMPSAQSGGASKAPPMATGGGGFGPGIGIQRSSASGAGSFSPAAAAAAAGGGYNAYAGAGAYNPAAAARPAQAPAAVPYTGSAPTNQYQTETPTPSTTRGPTLDQNLVIAHFEKLRQKEPASNVCFDCGGPNPEWASVSFGCLVCIECSGYHRQMGTHISRIRSVKMDSWTQAAVNIWDHGGNKRLGEFFAANGVPPAQKFQRYVTPAAEWYREAWIKNRVFGKPVPPPVAGVNVGPCKEGAAVADTPKAAPPVDLLDMGGNSAPQQASAAPAVDLLDMGASTAAAAPKEADLLGVSLSTPSCSGGDILGLGFSSTPTPAASNGLLGLDMSVSTPAAVPQTDINSLISASQRTPQTHAAAAPANSMYLSPAAPTPAPAANGFGGAPLENTMAGGAKFKAKEVPKDDDPFAMALDKWGM